MKFPSEESEESLDRPQSRQSHAKRPPSENPSSEHSPLEYPFSEKGRRRGGWRFLYPISILSALAAVSAYLWLFGAEARIEQRDQPASLPAGQAVLVELFTSQGCSSCPPADKVLRRLIKEKEVDGVQVISLGEHVDYWNRLGWTDPFSSDSFSRRQREYARLWQSRSVYTPQMVVDGRYEFVGSSYSRAIHAIRKAARQQREAHISLKSISPIKRVSGKGASGSAGDREYRVDIELLLHKSIESARLYIAVAEQDLVTYVKRGENAGRRLKYGSVTRLLQPVASLDSSNITVGKALNFSAQVGLKSSWNQKRVLLVSFAQSLKDGRILAASSSPI